MRKWMMVIGLLICGIGAWGDEVTWTCVNFSHSTVSGSAAEFQFTNCVNVLVTDNSTGKSAMLAAFDSASTGAAHDFVAGPPLVADYGPGGANSVLIATGGTTFLSGAMEDSGRLEAGWPDRAGAFLSRFAVGFVDPAVLESVGSPTDWAPEGSVSATLAETTFDGTTLGGVLGGAEFTITTEAVSVIPEPATLFLLVFGMGALLAARQARRNWR